MEKLNTKIDVEAQKLCSDCMEELKKIYHFEDPIPKSSHCHHPEPEKLPCQWCKVWRTIKLTWHDTPFWNDISYLLTKSKEPLVKCPVCGEKI